MDIQSELTKQVFEKYVPAVKSPEHNDSVYNRLKGQFALSYNALLAEIISPELAAQAEAQDLIKQQMLRWVSIHTFVAQARALDLVLTATGFGIVNTESTAPASQERVNSLIAQEQLELVTVRTVIAVQMLGIEGWGATVQAGNCIDALLWNSSEIWAGTILRPSIDEWFKVTARIQMAENVLRGVISDEYMEELLQKMRTNNLENADIIIVNKCKAFTFDYINRYDETKGLFNRRLLDDVMLQLETYTDSYPTYVDSKVYAAKHSERYENKREDPTFFFM